MASETGQMAAELLRGSTHFLFQAVTRRIRRADDLAVGDRVMVLGRESFRMLVITALEPDGRLAQLSFGHQPLGWWDRMDLRKDSHGCAKTNIS